VEAYSTGTGKVFEVSGTRNDPIEHAGGHPPVSVRQEDTPELGTSDRLRIIRNGLVNYSAQFVGAAAGLLLIPIIIREIGVPSYGFFVTATPIGGLVAVIDLGLAWSVTREVAAADSSSQPEEARRFARGALVTFALAGLVGGLLVFITGAATARAMGLSPEVAPHVPAVYAGVGAGFLSHQLLIYCAAVLHGKQRFVAANVLSILHVVLRTTGVLVALAAGGGLVAVVWVGTATAALAGAIGIAAIWHRWAFMRPRFTDFRWRYIRPHVPFGIASHLTTFSIRALWDAPLLTLAFLSGHSALVPYHLGQKFPLAASSLYWRMAETLFPSASQDARAGRTARFVEVLEVGTRSILLVAVPVAGFLFVYAAELMELWLGRPAPAATAITRLMALAGLVDALSVTALQVTWGAGRIRRLVLILIPSTILVVGLTVILTPGLGARGAAAAFLVGLSIAGAELIRGALKDTDTTVLQFIGRCFSGLWTPIGALGAILVITRWTVTVETWLALLAIGGLVAGFYFWIVYLTTPRQEERRMVAAIASSPLRLVRFVRADRSGR
jgi:O-antigen/teichoic acid export membrane protein